MPPASDEVIEARLREVLARDEFRGLEDVAPDTDLIAQLAESIYRALRGFLGDLGTSHPAFLVVLLGLGLALLGVSVWYGARGAARRRGGDVADARFPVSELLTGDPSVLRAEAEVAAAAGRYLEAVRLSFRATILTRALREGALERPRDAESFRRARTYRELVDEFARDHAQAERMRALAVRIEQGLYAGEELGPPDWEAARACAREVT